MKARDFAAGLVLICGLGGCSEPFDGYKGEPDPAPPMTVEYATAFPLVVSTNEALISVSVTPDNGGIEGLALRARLHSASTGVVSWDTDEEAAVTGVVSVLSVAVPWTGELAIVEMYALGRYGHGGVYPQELATLKFTSEGVDIRALNDAEEPVITESTP